MAQLIYVLQFKGSAGPVEGQEGVMQAKTHAAAAQVTTTIVQRRRPVTMSETMASAPERDKTDG